MLDIEIIIKLINKTLYEREELKRWKRIFRYSIY